jgi:hypothetical protein
MASVRLEDALERDIRIVPPTCLCAWGLSFVDRPISLLIVVATRTSAVDPVVRHTVGYVLGLVVRHGCCGSIGGNVDGRVLEFLVFWTEGRRLLLCS